MKERRIIVIGGGDWFPSNAAFLESLRSKEVTMKYLTASYRDWKANLKNSLGDGYTIVVPTMPCKQNAKFAAWAAYFEKVAAAAVNEDAILIGHSLGAQFIAKYLDTRALPCPVAETFLVSAPFNNKPRSEFAVRTSLRRFKKQAGQVFLYHSEDDKVVPFAEFVKYRERLPAAQVRTFTDRGHFGQQRLPELIDDIRSL